MLYYRTDLMKAAGIAKPPTTWSEMIADCKKIQATPEGKGVACYAGQFEKYEGLTVNASEVINGAGGEVTDASGKPNVNTPEAAKGLDFLVNGFKQGYIPKEAITYKEEEGRRAFQAGKLIFHRQWPYMYNLANGDEGTRSRASSPSRRCRASTVPARPASAVTTWPSRRTRSTRSRALDFIKFYTSEERQKKNLQLASQCPDLRGPLRRQGAAARSTRTCRPCGTRSTTLSRGRRSSPTATPPRRSRTRPTPR